MHRRMPLLLFDRQRKLQLPRLPVQESAMLCLSRRMQMQSLRLQLRWLHDPESSLFGLPGQVYLRTLQMQVRGKH